MTPSSLTLRVFAVLALLIGCNAQWYGKDAMGGNPMVMIGKEVCHYVLKHPKEAACADFKSNHRHVIDAHEKTHSKTGADVALCEHVFDIINADKKLKSISEDKDLWDKYCESHFGVSPQASLQLPVVHADQRIPTLGGSFLTDCGRDHRPVARATATSRRTTSRASARTRTPRCNYEAVM